MAYLTSSVGPGVQLASANGMEYLLGKVDTFFLAPRVKNEASIEEKKFFDARIYKSNGHSRNSRVRPSSYGIGWLKAEFLML